jgi:hypothetical protein
MPWRLLALWGHRAEYPLEPSRRVGQVERFSGARREEVGRIVPGPAALEGLFLPFTHRPLEHGNQAGMKIDGPTLAVLRGAHLPALVDGALDRERQSGEVHVTGLKCERFAGAWSLKGHRPEVRGDPGLYPVRRGQEVPELGLREGPSPVFALYLPPENWPDLGTRIPDSLIPTQWWRLTEGAGTGFAQLVYADNGWLDASGQLRLETDSGLQQIPHVLKFEWRTASGTTGSLSY